MSGYFSEVVSKYGYAGDHFPESRAKTWWVHAYRRAMYRRLVKLPPGSLIVDYGCGCGTWTPYYLKHSCTVVGYDPVPESIVLANKNYGGVRARFQDTRVGLPKGDIVVANTSLIFGPSLEEEVRQAFQYGRRFIILDFMPRELKPWMTQDFHRNKKFVWPYSSWVDAVSKFGDIETDDLITVIDTGLVHYTRKLTTKLDWPVMVLTFMLDYWLSRILQFGRYRIMTGVVK